MMECAGCGKPFTVVESPAPCFRGHKTFLCQECQKGVTDKKDPVPPGEPGKGRGQE